MDANEPKALPLTKTGADDDTEVLFPWLVWIRKQLEALRNFRRTRAAILAHEYLYVFPNAELKDRKYTPPLRFNVLQSTYATLPAASIGWIYEHMLGQQDPVAKEPLLPPDTFIAKVLSERAFAWFQHAWPAASGALVPYTALAIAVVAGWASLRPKDASMANINRNRRAFLYFDAAYNFTPQLLFASVFTLAPIVFRAGGQGIVVLFALKLLFAAISLWAAYASFVRIPALLWNVRNYPAPVSGRLFLRYYLAMGWAAPLTTVVVYLVLKAGTALAAAVVTGLVPH